jgi:hypothetical protein
MEIASAVFKHNFDKNILEQIDTLRTVRLQMAQKMLREIDKVTVELETRGLVAKVDQAELRKELVSRIKTMQERLKRPDVVYSDEVGMYAELLEASDAADDDIFDADC